MKTSAEKKLMNKRGDKADSERKRNSPMWAFFTLVTSTTKPDGSNLAISRAECKHCKWSIKFSGSTSGLKTHQQICVPTKLFLREQAEKDKVEEVSIICIQWCRYVQYILYHGY
jgi:hypothetical protein